MKKILKVLCLILASVCLLSMISCKKEESYTYWQTESKKAGDMPLVYVSALTLSKPKDVKYDGSYAKVSSIWMNASHLKSQEATITIRLKTSESSDGKTVDFHISKTDIKDAKKNNGGWIKYSMDSSVESKFAIIDVTDELRMNEICFIDEENNIIPVEFKEGGVKGNKSAENLYPKSDLENLDKDNLAYSINPSFNIVDEQERFPKELLNK